MIMPLSSGVCDPPVGAILFVGCALPFWDIMFAVPVLITYLPWLPLYPPHLLRL